MADEILAGTRAEAVQWLAGWAYKTSTRMLQRAMERAWQEAFEHRPATLLAPRPAGDAQHVTPTIMSIDIYYLFAAL